MAISFKVRVPEGGSLKLRVTGAYYDRVRVTVPETPPLTGGFGARSLSRARWTPSVLAPREEANAGRR